MNDAQRDTLNTFFVDTFNRILAMEEHALSKSTLENLSVKELHIIEAVSVLTKSKRNTMTEIASQVGITVGALTTAVNTLVKKEYLERRHSEEDRRHVFIFLTAKGMRAEMHHRIFHENMVSDVGNLLNEEELKHLLNALKKLSHFFKEQVKE